jgi:hypothetical protein
MTGGQKLPELRQNELRQNRGEGKLPPNLPGDAVVLQAAAWLHCDSCGEDILRGPRSD